MSDFVDGPVIRPYRAEDRAACFDICVRTADAGGDARGLYGSDDLMPELFFAPYVDLDPGLAFVVDAGGSVGGYVIAAADTRTYVTRYRTELLPAFAAKHPYLEPSTSAEAFMVSLGHDPERLLLPEIDEYPAHLHVDLLPELQGPRPSAHRHGTCGACRARSARGAPNDGGREHRRVGVLRPARVRRAVGW